MSADEGSDPSRASHYLSETDHREVERLREAVYGTIVVLSVLSVLSEKSPDAAEAALSVAGTSFVLFFAQVYAGSIAERIRLGRLPGWATLLPLAADSWPVVAVTLWPLVLLGIAAVGFIGTEFALALATWLSVAALAVWGWTAGRIANSSMSRRLWSTGLDVAVGLGIVALKVAFH